MWEITYNLITPWKEERWRSFVRNIEQPNEDTLRTMWRHLEGVSFYNICIRDITEDRPEYPQVDCVLEIIR
ncbi:MAG: hypothetical protein PVF74_14510 [Anaerolineales bacterium]